MHYREILMAIDTAKLIMASLPQSTRLVVSGIPAKYQASMAELEEAKARANETPKGHANFLILFPDDAARTIDEIVTEQRCRPERRPSIGAADQNEKQAFTMICDDSDDTNKYDVVVIDGTWQQARRIKLRYFPPPSASKNPTVPLQTVKLGPAALALMQQVTHPQLPSPSSVGPSRVMMNDGHQLRKHPVTWKRIATFEAVRLFLADFLQGPCNPDRIDGDIVQDHIPPWVQIADYLRIANEAALKRKGKCW
jgi:DTW domain-containing protein YfiP